MADIKKNHEQDFSKKIGEHSTPVIVVNAGKTDRSNIDQIDDVANPKDAWVERVSEVLDYDKGTTTLEAGTKLYVDGDLKVDTKIYTDYIYSIEPSVAPSSKFTHIGDTNNKTSLQIAGNLSVGLTTTFGGAISGTTGTFSTLSGGTANFGTFGQAISYDDFVDEDTIHADTTISDFEAYRVGQFVYVHFVVTSSSFTANDTIFKIKSNSYFPDHQQFLTVNGTNGFDGAGVTIMPYHIEETADDGKVICTKSATGSTDTLYFTLTYKHAYPVD